MREPREVVEVIDTEVITCPHCNYKTEKGTVTTKILQRYKSGSKKGEPRYKKDPSTGKPSPIYRSHLDYFDDAKKGPFRRLSLSNDIEIEAYDSISRRGFGSFVEILICPSCGILFDNAIASQN